MSGTEALQRVAPRPRSTCHCPHLRLQPRHATAPTRGCSPNTQCAFPAHHPPQNNRPLTVKTVTPV
eukprot:244466-Chlamydomonas_euryale.AAC.1